MSNERRGLLTVREIAEELGETKTRVFSALRHRNVAILPAGRASQTLLFDPSVVPIIRAVLKGMDANGSGGARFGGLEESGGSR